MSENGDWLTSELRNRGVAQVFHPGSKMEDIVYEVAQLVSSARANRVP